MERLASLWECPSLVALPNQALQVDEARDGQLGTSTPRRDPGFGMALTIQSGFAAERQDVSRTERQRMEYVVGVAVWGSVVAMFAAGIACGLRRWRLAVRLARTVVLASPILLVAIVVAFIVLPLSGQAVDPSMNATALPLGMSQAVNCGVLVLAAAIPALVMWSGARARLRRRSAG